MRETLANVFYLLFLIHGYFLFFNERNKNKTGVFHEWEQLINPPKKIKSGVQIKTGVIAGYNPRSLQSNTSRRSKSPFRLDRDCPHC